MRFPTLHRAGHAGLLATLAVLLAVAVPAAAFGHSPGLAPLGLSWSSPHAAFTPRATAAAKRVVLRVITQDGSVSAPGSQAACRADCRVRVRRNAVVTLVGTPAPDFRFAG